MSKKNGFLLYVEAMKPSFLAAGHQFSGGLKELVALCSDGWQGLTQEERKKYSDDAKAYNECRTKRSDGGKQSEKQSPPPPPTITTEDPGNSSAQDLAVMENARGVVCRMFEKEDWRSQPVVICTFSLYVEPGYAQVFLPAEIALTAFSIHGGVVDNFSRVIDPGKVPLGYGIEAVHTAIKLGLPQFGTVPEFADYEPIMMILESFLQHYNKGTLNGGDNLYLFAFESEYGQISRCLEWLYKRTNYRLPIKILSLSLWCYLASAYSSRPSEGASGGNPSSQRKSVTTRVSTHRKFGESLIGCFVYSSLHPLTKFGLFVSEDDVEAVIKEVDNFKYFDELCCVFHVKEGLEIQNCALTSSNRYAFSILEVLTLSNEVPIIRGGHFPEIDNSRVEKARRYNMLRRWGITHKEEEMEVRQHNKPEEPPQPRHSDFRRRSGEQRTDLDRRFRDPQPVGASHREDEGVVQEAQLPRWEFSTRRRRDSHVTFRDSFSREESNFFGGDQYVESEDADNARSRREYDVGGGTSQSERRRLMAGVDTGRDRGIVRVENIPSIFYGSQASANGKR